MYGALKVATPSTPGLRWLRISFDALMPNGSERSGLLHRLKPSIWLDAGAGGEKGVYMVLSRTLVLGELKFSCTPSSLRLFLSHTIDYFAFMEQLPCPSGIVSTPT
jgi:hypothetical protein